MSERPNEVMFRGLLGVVHGCKQVKVGLTHGTRHVLDPDGKVVARCNKMIAEAEQGIDAVKPKLAAERKEFVIAERAKDEWASPSCVDGWLCPDSPTGVCVYEKPPNWDCCDYCGFPDERK